MNTPATSRGLLDWAAQSLKDPEGRSLAAHVQWWDLPALGDAPPQSWPVAVMGEGPTVLLLHGFDSSFLEFRRLVPLLLPSHTIVIPDLFGFGFTPRPAGAAYGPDGVLAHLENLLDRLPARVGLIGASMGGAVALQLARRRPQQIDRLLLLDPAGLSGEPRPLPLPLAALGVRFLSLPWIRERLCRSAFADPAAAVGAPELEISTLHLRSPGWANALCRFAVSGGFAGCGEPLPPQPLAVLWGEQDRILGPALRRHAEHLFAGSLVSLPHCGHLPHLDQPEQVHLHWGRLGQAPRPCSPLPTPSPPSSLPFPAHGPAA